MSRGGTARDVMAMYSKWPYPSRVAGKDLIYDLANLFRVLLPRETLKGAEVLDAGWSTLIRDLQQRGLLETTAIVWMGEFGRTPKINANAGRDHFPTAWTTVLAGGGINGGRVIGRTSADGMGVEDRPVSVPDLIATVCLALGIDPKTQNVSNVGRPIRIVDTAARPIKEALS